MNPYLKTSLKWFALAAAVIWLWLAYGCAAMPPARGAQTYCVPNAISAAWTWGAIKGDPVRIAVTKLSPTVDHAQAEALIGGLWTPLSEFWTGTYVEIRPWKRHFPKAPYRYPALKEWIDEQIRYTNQ